MKKFILLVAAAFCLHFGAGAQGNVTEKIDPKVSQLMTRFVEVNKSSKAIKGWRIQILATTDRQRMESALQQFNSLYPNIFADWVHNKPYYKVRAGAYANKRDAMRALYQLKPDYPAAYVVPDNEIKPEELLR
ncbi:MAG: SPOR domain-containing protein [Bacteroidota bacterium]